MPQSPFARRVVGLFLKNIVSSQWFRALYVWALSGREGQSTNNVVLKTSLRAAGFNPSDTSSRNGESRVAEALAKVGCRTALDIGANVGLYSSMLTQAGFERVDAFEPHPDSYTRLEEVSLASRGKIVAHRIALGASHGKSFLNFASDALVLASLSSEASRVPYVEFTDAVEVEVSTIDEFCRGGKNVDFIKIDTEGFERQVLTGGTKTFASFPPLAVQVEFNHHHLFTGDSLLSLHSQIGDDYKAYRLLTNDHGVVEVDTTSPYANLFLFSNYIFVRQVDAQEFERAMGMVE